MGQPIFEFTQSKSNEKGRLSKHSFIDHCYLIFQSYLDHQIRFRSIGTIFLSEFNQKLVVRRVTIHRDGAATNMYLPFRNGDGPFGSWIVSVKISYAVFFADRPTDSISRRSWRCRNCRRTTTAGKPAAGRRPRSQHPSRNELRVPEKKKHSKPSSIFIEKKIKINAPTPLSAQEFIALNDISFCNHQRTDFQAADWCRKQKTSHSFRILNETG